METNHASCWPDHPSRRRLYGTGDYVKLSRENAMLYYEGRCDAQIKVRGHRVDLSEIEKAVSSIEGVERAVVLCYKPNEVAQKVLCYFTSCNDKEKVLYIFL